MKIEILKKRVTKMRAHAEFYLNGGDSANLALKKDRRWAYRRVSPLLIAGQRTLSGLGNSILSPCSTESRHEVYDKIQVYFRDHFKQEIAQDRSYRINEFLYFDHPNGQPHVEIQILDDVVGILDAVLISERPYTDIDSEKLGQDLRILTLSLEKKDDTWEVAGFNEGSAYDYDNHCFIKQEPTDPMMAINNLLEGSPYPHMTALQHALTLAGKGMPGYKIYQQIASEWSEDVGLLKWTLSYDAHQNILVNVEVERGPMWVGVIVLDRPTDHRELITIKSFTSASKPMRESSPPIEDIAQPIVGEQSAKGFLDQLAFLGQIGPFAMDLTSFDQAKYFFDEVFRNGNIWLYNALKNAFEPKLGRLSPKNLSYRLDVAGNWQEALGEPDADITLTGYLRDTNAVVFEVTGSMQL